MIAKASQIVFKNLISFFRLIIRLKMKNNVKSTLNFRVIAQNWSKVACEQNFTIWNYAFRWIIFQKNVVEKQIAHFICFHCELDRNVNCHLDITIYYHHDRIVNFFALFVWWKLCDHVNDNFFSWFNRNEQLKKFIVKTMIMSFRSLTNDAFLMYFSIFFRMYIQ